MNRKAFWLYGLDSGITHTKIQKSRLPNRTGEKGEDAQENLSGRFFLFYVISFLILSIFLGRLFLLNVVDGDKNRELSQNNRVRLNYLEAPRGKIFDQKGKILVGSEIEFDLRKGKNLQKITSKQANDLEVLGLASENFEGEMGKVERKVIRAYSQGEVTAHVLGYTTIAAAKDLAERPTLRLGDKVGLLGIEQSYNDYLTGKPGRRIIEVDAFYQKVSILGSEEPQEGRSLYLTLDSELQKVAFDALKKQAEKVGSMRGAVVIQNPNTGAVLALVSLPSFDPLNIVLRLDDSNKPFLNRVVAGTYPPGSVFKIVSALSGLASGQFNRDTQIEDVGQFDIGGTRFSNWYFTQYGGLDGILKIDRAIARSNDVFFYKLGEKVGLSAIRKMAIALGFGQKTGIDLPNETFGLVPDEIWKKSTYQTDWYVGDTLHLAIGQGFMLATPIQINKMVSFAATKKITRPFLVSKIGAGHKTSEALISPRIDNANIVSDDSYRLIRQGMLMACETGGTGWPFFNAPYKIGCKTGTAEKGLGDPHAWFAAFAPFDDPQIAITVLVEDGGEGSTIAGPVARQILDWWFHNRK